MNALISLVSMLKRDELEMLINEKDNYGNTPLQLASKERHPKVVSILTWDKRVSLKSLARQLSTSQGTIALWGFPHFERYVNVILILHTITNQLTLDLNPFSSSKFCFRHIIQLLQGLFLSQLLSSARIKPNNVH